MSGACSWAPPATSATALLDQVPEVGVVVRGAPITDLLRVVYLMRGDVGTSA